MRNSLRLTVEFMEKETLKPYILERYSPNPEKVDLASDEECDEWIKDNTHSGYHLSCTCAMGSVVDAEGRVFGVDGLRVVDASIMPSMTSGNLNAPTTMLAEKMADSIRGEQLPADAIEIASWYEPDKWET